MKNIFSHPALRNDAGAIIYAAKSFAAAMLAYYIALSIGLERPSWAIITVYIVSQTSVGASLSRSLYRLAGTVVGACATVLIVPNFANTPILCSAVLTGWIAFCLWLSLLERTPRAYAFVLAGYTASLIGFPAVSDPGGIFNVAIVRVQEIAIGIFCAALIHRYVLPARVSGQFNAKLSQTLRAARGRVADTLAGKPDAASGPLHLALALQFLQGISHHIPYDFALSAPVRQARKAIHDRLARLVIVNCELHDRLPAIGTLPAEVQILLEDVQAWLAAEGDSRGGEALRHRSAQLIARYAAQAQTFDDALRVSFIRYLFEAITLLQQCERLSGAIRHAKPAFGEVPTRAAKGYVFHRDPLTAARTALGAFAIILSGCLVWIFSAWPDGGTAVSILGVCCTLFGSFDTPAPLILGRADEPALQLCAAAAGERFPGAGGGACPGVSAGRVASGAPAHHVYGDGDHPDAAHSVRAGCALQRRLRRSGQHRHRALCRDRLRRREHEPAANRAGGWRYHASAEPVPARHSPLREGYAAG